VRKAVLKLGGGGCLLKSVRSGPKFRKQYSYSLELRGIPAGKLKGNIVVKGEGWMSATGTQPS